MSESYYAPPGSESSDPSAPGAEKDPNVIQMFMLVIGIAVVFLFITYYLPARQGKPNPDAKRPPAASGPTRDPHLEKLREELISEFSQSMSGVSSPEDIQRILSGQMAAIQNDPSFSPDQREELQKRLQDMAKRAGS